MNKPILMAVDKDETSLLFVGQELRKRYAADYEVICDPSAEAALSILQALKDKDRQVALLFTDQSLPEMTGIEFLNRAHDLHPNAKRILLVGERDWEVPETILQAMTFGWIDSYLWKPTGAFDERFHSQIAELLEAWRHLNLPRPALRQGDWRALVVTYPRIQGAAGQL